MVNLSVTQGHSVLCGLYKCPYVWCVCVMCVSRSPSLLDHTLCRYMFGAQERRSPKLDSVRGFSIRYKDVSLISLLMDGRTQIIIIMTRAPCLTSSFAIRRWFGSYSGKVWVSRYERPSGGIIVFADKQGVRTVWSNRQKDCGLSGWTMRNNSPIVAIVTGPVSLIFTLIIIIKRWAAARRRI